MIMILHDTLHDRLAHVVYEGLMEILPQGYVKVVTDRDQCHFVPPDVKVLIVTSANPAIMAKYDHITGKEGVKQVLVDTFDIGRTRPSYEPFDLVFLREYGEEYKNAKGIVPLSMGLQGDRLCEIENYAKSWDDREIDIFYCSMVDIPVRRNIVEAFNNQDLIKKHGLDGFEIQVGSLQMSEGEFYETMGNSKVCLSPPGGGWDCFRHYEALAAGSYPVMSKHWYWHPAGYTTPVGAMEQARRALTDGPDWLAIGINLEDDLYKATFIWQKIKELFR